MPAKRSNASALLKKVNSQLQGERIAVKANEEDELAMYLNNLTQKVQQKRVDNFEDYGDVSLSSGVDAKNSASLNDNNSSSPAALTNAPASRFLKKKPTLDVATSKNIELEKAEINAKNNRISTSTTDRNGSKHKHQDEIIRTLGSQFVPSDQDSLAEFIQGLSMSESSARRPQNLVARKQQKWHKKTPSTVSHSPSPVLGSRTPSPFKRSNSPFGKLSRSVSQDTDAADVIDSEILENRQESDNSDDHFKLSSMNVASLQPISGPPRSRKNTAKHLMNEPHKSGTFSGPNFSTSPATAVKEKGKERTKSPKKSESRSSLFDAFGLHMADELLPSKEAQSVISEESEIRTESSGRQRKSRQRQHTETTNSHDLHRKTALLEKSSSETSVSEAIPSGNSAAKRSYDTEKTDVEYSDSFDSESRMVTQTASLKSKDRKTLSRTHGSQNNSQSHRRRSHKVVMEEMLVDVSVADAKDGRHHWNANHMNVRMSTPYGLQYVDPAPIATQVVSADALEALTAYSPNMLALQEMMKAQLQLVKNFMDIQHRIYNSCMDGLNYDYKYTTLEDTKEYISRNRKPHMTAYKRREPHPD